MDKYKGLTGTKNLGQMIGKVYLLREASLSRLRKVAILFNVQKPTQRGNKNEETMAYVPNKRTR